MSKDDDKDDAKNTSVDFDLSEVTWSHLEPSWYRIDPEKVKTVQDIAKLLDAINIKFLDTHSEFDKISHLLSPEDAWAGKTKK